MMMPGESRWAIAVPEGSTPGATAEALTRAGGQGVCVGQRSAYFALRVHPDEPWRARVAAREIVRAAGLRGEPERVWSVHGW